MKRPILTKSQRKRMQRNIEIINKYNSLTGAKTEIYSLIADQYDISVSAVCKIVKGQR